MNTTAPTGVVTFLFTDIEGSTRRWEADADAMRSALAAHDAQLRDAIQAHDGWLFKHTGDGVCAVFSSPRSAVDAAVDAQRALELPVRMGIATGEAELRGEDYFGAVLNRAARVMSAGHGGQILVDGATAELVSAVDLIELGQRRLRDIAKAVEISQVRVEGLRADFPPLTTLDATPGNLRQPTTSFVGREPEARRAGVASQGPSLGDLDRRRRSRQDPTGTGSRSALGTGLPRRCLGNRTRAGRRPGRCARSGRRCPRHKSAARADYRSQRRRSVGKPDPTAGLRQLRACSRRSRRHDRSRPFPLGALEDPCDQPRRPAGGRRKALACTVSRLALECR